MKTGSTNATERVGLTVLYTLNDADARSIIQGRIVAGSAAARGNDPHDGETYPALIVRDFGSSAKPEAIDERVRAFGDTLAKRYAMSQGATNTGEPGYPSEYADMTTKQFGEHLAGERIKFRKSIEDSNRHASVNLQVFLDGIDVYWATSRSEFDPSKDGRWVQTTQRLEHDNEDLELPAGYEPTEADYERGDVAFRPDARGRWQRLEA